MDTQILFSKSFINRVGITLNFFAGFLLAPELIGLERLRKIEDELEKYLTKIRNEILPTLEKTIKGNYLSLRSNPYLALLGFIVGMISLIAATLLVKNTALENFLNSNLGKDIIYILNLSLCINVTYNSIKEIFYAIKNKSGVGNIIGVIFANTLGFVMIVFLLFDVYIFLVLAFFFGLGAVWLILNLIVRILSFIVNKSIVLLEGESRIKEILIPLGLTFFIMGNLLQFLGA